MTFENASIFPAAAVWEDLVNDFLEMACFLTEAERELVIQELRAQEIDANAIHVHPSFSLDGKVIVICEEMRAEECWLFYPKENKISKIAVLQAKSQKGKGRSKS